MSTFIYFIKKNMKNIKKAFTLIELLVVITIIWILATWSVSIYTSKIQKARDATRLNDITALQSWVEQFYQDTYVYPDWWDFWTWWVQAYVPKLPSDPKTNQDCNKWDETQSPKCDYVYWVASDKNGIEKWAYEISTAFENSWNIKKYAKEDWWNESNRYEIGLFVSAQGGAIDTQKKQTWSDAGADDTVVIISWKAKQATDL